MDLKETDLLGDSAAQHWYYRSKAQAMLRLLRKESPTCILDVGAGSGFFAKHLLAASEARSAWCLDISYSEESETRWYGKPVHFVRSVNALDADLVLFMDVLEHVDDDVGLLKEILSKIRPDAKVLISVPAFQSLWSDHDVFLEHKRRYRLQGIESVVRRAGLQVIEGCYFFAGVFPLAAAARLAARTIAASQAPRSQLRQHHPWVNAALAGVCSLELPLMHRNRVAGLTAFCLAQAR